MKHEHLFFALLVATPLSFAASPPEASPGAASELNPVTVSGFIASPQLRLDVRAACPGIDAALQESLSSAWGRVQESATMRVQFWLDDGRVTEVRSTGSNWDYRPFVRRAVRQLDCGPSGAGKQEFAFVLDIVSPDLDTSRRVAVLGPGGNDSQVRD
jgi:hypothetical protein